MGNPLAAPNMDFDPRREQQLEEIRRHAEQLGRLHGDFPARAFIGTDKILRNGHYEVLGIAVKRSH